MAEHVGNAPCPGEHFVAFPFASDNLLRFRRVSPISFRLFAFSPLPQQFRRAPCPPVSVDAVEEQACMLVDGPDSLADELWQNILSQLCFIDLLNCSRINKRLHHVSQNDSIWSSLFEAEFGVRCCPRVEQTSREAFRERYPFSVDPGQQVGC